MAKPGQPLSVRCPRLAWESERCRRAGRSEGRGRLEFAADKKSGGSSDGSTRSDARRTDPGNLASLLPPNLPHCPTPQAPDPSNERAPPSPEKKGHKAATYVGQKRESWWSKNLSGPCQTMSRISRLPLQDRCAGFACYPRRPCPSSRWHGRRAHPCGRRTGPRIARPARPGQSTLALDSVLYLSMYRTPYTVNFLHRLRSLEAAHQTLAASLAHWLTGSLARGEPPGAGTGRRGPQGCRSRLDPLKTPSRATAAMGMASHFVRLGGGSAWATRCRSLLRDLVSLLVTITGTRRTDHPTCSLPPLLPTAPWQVWPRRVACPRRRSPPASAATDSAIRSVRRTESCSVPSSAPVWTTQSPQPCSLCRLLLRRSEEPN